MFTKVAIQRILNALLGKSSSADLAPTAFIGLSTTTPTPTQGSGSGWNFTEPAASTGYTRVLIGAYNASATFKMFEQSDGSYENHDPNTSGSNNAILFPTAQSSWGTITHFGIWTAQTGGTLLAFGALTESVQVGADYVAVFEDGDLTFTLE